MSRSVFWFGFYFPPVPTSIDVSIRITEVNDTEAEYIKAYADPTSPEFKALEEDVCEPVIICMSSRATNRDTEMNSVIKT